MESPGIKKKSKGYLRLSLLIAVLIFVLPGTGYGYIMPAEQIIGFMATNFSKFKTLIITQSTNQGSDGNKEVEKVFKEKIWIKSPDLFRSKIIDEGIERVRVTDNTYRQLLIANNKKRLMRVLGGMGINKESVAFTRIDGLIAYRIGDKEPDRPKILIEKKRFLPLMLIYSLSEDPAGNKIKIRFRDYRKMEQGWYPFEITYSYGNEIIEKYAIHTLNANLPVDLSLFYSSKVQTLPGKAPEKGEDSLEEERLRQIIKTFEEKYQ